jgi:hypothetical protein
VWQLAEMTTAGVLSRSPRVPLAFVLPENLNEKRIRCSKLVTTELDYSDLGAIIEPEENFKFGEKIY